MLQVGGNSLPSGAFAAFHFPSARPIGQTKSVSLAGKSVILSDSALAFVDFYDWRTK